VRPLPLTPRRTSPGLFSPGVPEALQLLDDKDAGLEFGSAAKFAALDPGSPLAGQPSPLPRRALDATGWLHVHYPHA
jgi:hypothetical protein